MWQTKRCIIAWVKAQIGTEGNEAADKAARQGAENQNKNLDIANTRLPKAQVKLIIDKAI